MWNIFCNGYKYFNDKINFSKDILAKVLFLTFLRIGSMTNMKIQMFSMLTFNYRPHIIETVKSVRYTVIFEFLC